MVSFVNLYCGPTMNLMRDTIVGSILFIISGCAVLHSAQVGDIDSRAVLAGKPFDIKLSNIGFNVEEAASIAAAIAEGAGNAEGAESLSTVGDIIQLFQMGPKTGNPVFKVDYSDEMSTKLFTACPSGRITGLMAVRETAKYPALSGEIVRLTGYCVEG